MAAGAGAGGLERTISQIVLLAGARDLCHRQGLVGKSVVEAWGMDKMDMGGMALGHSARTSWSGQAQLLWQAGQAAGYSMDRLQATGVGIAQPRYKQQTHVCNSASRLSCRL